MFVSYFAPYAVRNDPVIYQWVLYKQLRSIGADDLAFLGDTAYLADPAKRIASRHSSANPDWMDRAAYVMPDPAVLAGLKRFHLGGDILKPVIDQRLGPNLAWRQIMRVPFQPLVALLKSGLSVLKRQGEIEAVLAWVNCASMRAAADEMGIPIIHAELGPTRAPQFRPTAYIDFSGVNGNTEASARYARFAAEGAPVPNLAPPEIMRALGWSGAIGRPTPSHETGLALQIPNDSNLVAYGNGFDNFELTQFARRRWKTSELLLRPHPGYPISPDPEIETDASPDAAGFIGRVKRIMTVNSSVAFEAMLHETPVVMLGECPFAVGGCHPRSLMPRVDAKAWLQWLNFTAFGYLAPYEWAFDPAYLRFRLTKPTEAEIIGRHLSYWM
ncbi:MAG: hypothetical protein QM698_16340 [Micropepsaceae bacterium]